MIPVYVPYVNLRPETREALDAYARDREVTYVDLGADPDAYWRFWRDLWLAGDSIAVVEHDITIGPETLNGFDACPEPWCAYRYPYSVFGEYAGTGCCRFRSSLIARTPRLWDEVATMTDELHPPKHFCRLDAWMQTILYRHGFTQHVHRPPVGHVDTDVSHGCVHVPARV